MPSPAPAAQAPAPSGAAPKPTGSLSLCNGAYNIGPPAKLPPAGSGPLVYLVALCFAKQGGTSVIDPQTYLYYIQLRWSLPSQDKWVPYTDASEDQIQRDFKALWGTNFLDDLSAETVDYVFSNGVVGKIVLYNMEERQRVKIVDYVGSKKVEQSKIDEELKKKGIQIRLDSFIDQGLVRRVAGVVRDMYAEKGYEFAEVKSEIKEVQGGPKTVNLTFNITEGPKVKIRSVEFLGNQGDHRQEARGEDEGQQGARFPRASSPAPAPTRKPSSRKTRRKSPTITARRATSRRASVSPSSRSSRTPRTPRPGSSSCRFR